MGYFFQETNSANKSLSNLDAQGNAKFTAKQDTLVSGENIKTINNISLLGSGDIQVGEGGTIVVDQSYNAASTYAQAGTAVAQAIATRASTALDNLSSGGQMIIDSANGTISNCILEIPQNLKLTLENNVLTLKAGSTITLTGSIYTTFTTTSDNSRTYSPVLHQRNKRNYVFCSFTGGLTNLYPMDKVKSGSTSSRPETAVGGEVFFDTDEKSFYLYNNGWTTWNVVYPLCMIDVDENNVMSFAKDSNGRDMIFNGAGFIGHHIFRLPNVSGYTGEGFTSGGKLNSNFYSPQNLLIQEMASGNPTYGKRCFGFQAASRMNYIEVDTVTESPAHQHIAWVYTYVREQNQMWVWTGNGLVKQHEVPLVYYEYDGTTVTDFTICQPYDEARYLLTDEIKEEVATKQADVTTLTGYDATKTQTLKNVSGVLTWVDD